MPDPGMGRWWEMQPATPRGRTDYLAPPQQAEPPSLLQMAQQAQAMGRKANKASTSTTSANGPSGLGPIPGMGNLNMQQMGPLAGYGMASPWAWLGNMMGGGGGPSAT